MSTSQRLAVDISNNKFVGELSFPTFRLDSRAASEIVEYKYGIFDFYARYNMFSSLKFEGKVSYLGTLDIGSNSLLNGTLPKSLFNSNLRALLADGTNLSGDFPNLSGITASVRVLDLSNTSINFCPSTWNCTLRTQLTECNLDYTNVDECIENYPDTCLPEGDCPILAPSLDICEAIDPPDAPRTLTYQELLGPLPSTASTLTSNMAFIFALVTALAGLW